MPVRKAGKLPRETHTVAFDLEYGEAILEIHRDAIAPGERVLLVDDVLATGGTLAATRQLVEACGGVVVGCRDVDGAELSSRAGGLLVSLPFTVFAHGLTSPFQGLLARAAAARHCLARGSARRLPALA